MNDNTLNMALQLSVQDMFTSSWFTGAVMNKVWTEVMRSSLNGLGRNAGGADLLGVALGGSLRGDAAMLRQASSNLTEAQAMMNMAADAAGNIASQLKEAKTLADDFLAATQGMNVTDPDYAPIYERFQAQYQAIGKNIDAVIKNTTYNGIALLDGNAWNNGGERLTVTRNASNAPLAASVHIQAGDNGFPLTFNNMAAEFSDVAGRHMLVDATWPWAPRQDVAAELSSLQRSAQNMADLYAGRAGSLGNQSASLRSQATILEEAAARQIRTPEPVNTEKLLLDLILRDSGTIFSAKG